MQADRVDVREREDRRLGRVVDMERVVKMYVVCEKQGSQA
jgi:hypothetical protein